MRKIIAFLFYAVLVVSLLAQIINIAQVGPNRETLVLVSELSIFIFALLMFAIRKPLARALKSIPLPIKFVLLGYLSTIIAEALYIFSKPIHKNFLIDILLVTPWYLLWMISWFFVFRRYNYSVKEAFYLGGFHGFVVEGLIAGGLILNPLLALFTLPLLTITYGAFFIISYFITKPEFKNQKQISLKKKILISLLPLLAYIPGFIWIAIITNALKLTLH